MYTLKSPICIPMINWRSVIAGQHTNHFHNPRVPKNAVPLGFCFGGFSSTADYAPATKLNLRRAAFAPFGGSLPPGAIRFYSNGSRKSRNLL